MSQDVKIYRTLQFYAKGGATRMSTIDTDDSATICYWRPETDDTGYLAIGDGTKDMDVKWFGGTSAVYALFDVGNSRFSLAGVDMATDAPVVITDATESTSTATGALIVSGGIGFAKDMYVGDDVFLTSGAILNFAAGDVTLTHAAGKLTLGGDGAVELDLDGSSMDVSLPSGCVDKADLASEVYTIEHIGLTGSTNDFDTQTVKLSNLWSAGTVVRVVYFTSAALGTGVGIDIVDGGTDGSGTDVIDSCSDALNGSDVNTLTTPYALSAGDYINVTFDNIDASVDFTIDIQVKVPVATAT